MIGASSSLLKRLVIARLQGLTQGELQVVDAGGSVTVGAPAADGLRATLTVHRDRLWRRVAFGGLLAATDAYLDGDWDADDLTRLARLFARNMDQVTRLDSGLGAVLRPLATARHALARNTRAGSRRNIAAHYDLGNDFFALMLDPTLSYSSGIFERPDASLEEASIAKIDRLCRKLALHSGDHLLEIGTGWGGFALHAAARYGCTVTTTTISRQQYDAAVRRVADAGLSHRIHVQLTDYRELTGRYSKIVSVEMIEAVGAEYFGTFFETCASLLEPDGLMALQAITVADQRFEAARRSPDFIKRHVFPGSCIPSIGALTAASSGHSDLRLVDLEDFTLHYARTLAEWRANLNRHREAVEAMTTERFRRLWALYLSYCEGGFQERHTGLVQMLLARPGWRGTIAHGSALEAVDPTIAPAAAARPLHSVERHTAA
jgi:cyclopropane-fatty-acyl-phospholipid synthase